MKRWLFGLGLVALGVSGCQPMEEPGDLFQPVQNTQSKPAPVVTPRTSDEFFDFEADGRGGDEASDDSTDLTTLQARFLGYKPDDVPSSPLSTKPTTAHPAAPVPTMPGPFLTPGAPSNRAFNPMAPVPGSWGIRLVSTTSRADPPRAILGFPDGHEVTVRAGTLLPDEGIVVLAVGTNAVQVAEIVPAGDHARVKTKLITALFDDETDSAND
ncbi:MAG: hypothetical protein HN348_13320 [Proteobacteria bacterium]|jgi:hypothetical protein|nr:hypothetical protein [Pseudomonadota bacterium]